MKARHKFIYAVMFIIAFLLSVYFSFFNQSKCVLCNSPIYHAPCLIDLETGTLTELDLYMPHETLVAELADPQPEMSTFSFIHLGNITGIKLTDSKTISFSVPTMESVRKPTLCKTCRSLLPSDYSGRYILADLYSADSKSLIPIEVAKELELRCYKITMDATTKESAISVTVQGTLEY